MSPAVGIQSSELIVANKTGMKFMTIIDYLTIDDFIQYKPGRPIPLNGWSTTGPTLNSRQKALFEFNSR